jgi:hypothetical protein
MKERVTHAMGVANVTASQAATLFNLNECGSFTAAQLRNLKRLHLAGTDPASPPDVRLVDHIKAEENAGRVRGCYLVETNDSQGNTKVAEARALFDGNAPETSQSDGANVKLTKSMKACAFVSIESFQRAKLNPDIIYVDIAECTNSENMPLLARSLPRRETERCGA